MKYILLTLLLSFTLSSIAGVSSSFSCSSVKGCSPLVVALTDHSTGNITSRTWNLGNGNTSTQANPSATYLNPGIYTITLTVSDGVQTDTSRQMITVLSVPVVNFTCDTTKTCAGDSIRFYQHVSSAYPISNYAWGFGNGIASSDSDAIYAYPQAGNFDVTLVAQDTNGCDGHLTISGLVTIWPRPVAAYTVSPAVSCGSSQTVAFTSQSTGSGLTYNWSFGDTGTSTAGAPSHLYSYGIFKSKMTVTNSDGCSSQTTQNISVIYLKADFVANKTTVCAGESVHFYNMSPMAGTSWYWNFGDGTSSTQNDPIKKYATPGVYSVTFVIKDAMCKDSSTVVGYMTVTPGFAVSFTADNQYSCTVPFTVNFTANVPAGDSLEWSFGNGTISTQSTPTVTYTTPQSYTVSLTAVDSNGCIVTSAVPGFINTTKPDVLFHTSDTLICPGVTVPFVNQSVNYTHCHWDFGDGDTSDVTNPSHKYLGYGRFTVSLTAWDSLGCDSTMVKPGYIYSDSTVVGFTVDEGFSKCPPLVSTFSSQVNRHDLKYLWNFGDGYTDTAANPTHIFFHAGLYTVSLTGTNPYGCTNTHTDSNLIVVQGPTGTFIATPKSGCVPLTVSFAGTVSANTESVACDLGDGSLYNDSLNFNYNYTSARVFYPKFVLTDHIGCSVAYDVDSIITFPKPVLNARDTAVCAGSTVQVNLGSDHYQWGSNSLKSCDTCLKLLSFCDTCSNVSLSPLDTTQYIVTATNDYGCIAVDTFSIMVDPMPVLVAQDTIKLCKNSSVALDAVSQAYKTQWMPVKYLNNSTAMQPICTPEADVDYTVTAYNELGCKISETVPVRLYDHIALSVTNDTAVCAGAQVALSASITDTFFHGVTYTWVGNAGLGTTYQPNTIITAQSETETYTVIAASATCGADTAKVTVSIHPAASVTLPGTITTTPYTGISLTPVSGDLVSYHWTAKDSLSCDTCPDPTIAPKESQMVYLSGTNQYGCATQDSMFIHILDCDPSSVFVPNTFTPNNDGVNDKLYVRSKTLAELEYFRVYNRWGAIVFESKSMSDGWDGTVNGRIAEQGVYVYQYSGKCENGYDVASSGTVTLVR